MSRRRPEGDRSRVGAKGAPAKRRSLAREAPASTRSAKPSGSGSKKSKLPQPPKPRRGGQVTTDERSAPTMKVATPTRRRKSSRRGSRSAVSASGAASSVRSSRPRRKMGRWSRAVLVASALLTTIVLGGQWMLHQSFFRVQHVHFTGAHHESVASLLAASGLTLHPTMIGLQATSIEHNLSRFSWIDHVDVLKQWPNSVTVQVYEGTPVAVAFDAKHILRYVDDRGRDLGRAPLNANLPTLDYLNPSSSTWPFLHAGFNAAYVAAQLPKAFSNQVSVVTVNDKGVVSLKMTTPVTFILGPPTQLQAKFVAIASVIAHSTLGPGDVVDVTVPGELAVSGPPPPSS